MIYGSLGRMSGGYLYDRIVVEGLRAAGHTVEVISMPDVGWWKALGHNWDGNLLEEALDLELDLLIQDELNHPSLFLFNRSFKRFAKRPILSVVHHLRSSEIHPPPLRLVYRWVESLYLDSVDGFLFNSHFTRNDTDRLSPLRGRPWVVAYPGKDRLGVRLTDEEVRQRCRQGGALRLLFVGNIIPRKGLHHLVQALAGLPPEGWELTVVGSQSAAPAYTRKIERCIAKRHPGARITFLGLQPDVAVKEIFRSSQVLLLPSEIEGYGIVYAEALGFGLPCLAASKGGAAEIVEEGVQGWLVAHGDEARLRDRIAALIQDRGLLERLSLAALQRFDRLPGWESTQRAVLDFLSGF